jgi:hypothetical protein
MRISLNSCLLVLALLATGCSENHLLTKQDYQKSQQDFLRGETNDALLDFPRRQEGGTFITSVEKGYLSLIQGKPQIKELQKQANILEGRVRYHVSREARTFFYVQTPEDYYASEHEVIWLHFLLSWGYSLQGKYSDACVEARIASSLLSLPWSPNGHFDDPSMRLFLAGLWTMCGEWHEAQVDLRSAWFMDNKLAWARELADHDNPPSHLFVILGGPGPEPVWNPQLSINPLRSERQLNFTLRGAKSPLSITDQHGVLVQTHLTPDASKWYERHLARESELHELVMDSAYGTKMAAGGVAATANIIATTGEGALIGAAAGVLGMIEAISKSNTPLTRAGTTNALIFGAALGGIAGGIVGAAEGFQDSAEELEQTLDPTPRYRFVRYLPEYLWMGWTDQTIDYPLELRTATAKITVRQPSIVNHTSVTLAHLPDARFSCHYQSENSSITIVPLLDAAGNCPPASSSTSW